ncbi:T9SS type A sorting domain-containing protein [Hymenobacter jeollabukensis]|uniref:T9SS type A sorting domain-containing protein n=1 Tax=Hymenobacter jeollabukensis TaxID=2025313 RepID=UPI0021D38D75|nr:T9SS type A sorting domain-containing protein [Hymenobacter jeollabukensis]
MGQYSSPGEDDYTGRGLINASKTLANLDKNSNIISRRNILTGPADAVLVSTRTGVCISGGIRFQPTALYDVEVYEITGTGPSDYSPDVVTKGRWVRTSSTNLRGPLGPPVTITKSNGSTVTSQASIKDENGAVFIGLAGKASVRFKGYVYHIIGKQDIESGATQAIDTWFPFDPRVTGEQGRIAYTNHLGYTSLIGQRSVNGTPQLSAYPNPAREELIIQLPQAETGAATVELLSLAGQRLRHEAKALRGEQLLRVPVASLRPGLYFYRVQTPTGVLQGKFTKAD